MKKVVIAVTLTLLVMFTLIYTRKVFAAWWDLGPFTADVDWNGQKDDMEIFVDDNLQEQNVRGDIWGPASRCGFIKAKSDSFVHPTQVGIANLREVVYYGGISEYSKTIDEGYWIEGTSAGVWAEKASDAVLPPQRVYDQKISTPGGYSITTSWLRIDGHANVWYLERVVSWPVGAPYDHCEIQYTVELNSQPAGQVAFGILWTYERPGAYPPNPQGALDYIVDRMVAFTPSGAGPWGITQPGVTLEISFTFDDAMKALNFTGPPGDVVNGLIGWDGGQLKDFRDANILYTDQDFSPVTTNVAYQPDGSNATWGIRYFPEWPFQGVQVRMENGDYDTAMAWHGVGPTGNEQQRVHITFSGPPLDPPYYILDASLPPFIQISPVKNTGQTFTTDLTVSNIANLCGFESNLTFDPTVLQCTGVEEGPFLATGGPVFWVEKSIDNTAGIIRFVATLYNVTQGVNGTGVLATATFKPVKLENSSISLRNVVLVDPLGIGLGPPIIIDGYFTPAHDLMVKYVNVSGRIEDLRRFSCSEVYPGWPVNVTISNIGNYEETANVTAYLSAPQLLPGTLIGRHATPVPPETDDRIEAKIPFEPDLGDLQLYTNYTLYVEVTPVRSETALGDNVYVYGYVLIKMTGDVNCDKKVNILDISAAAIGFGATAGQPRYDVRADIDCNQKIDILDIAAIAKNFGRAY